MIKVVKARRTHLPAIVRLWEEMLDYHKDIDPIFTRVPGGSKKYEKFISGSFGSSKQQLFVALDDDKAVGYAFIVILNPPPPLGKQKYGFITDMAVRRAYRRQGIGKMMLDEIMNWCRNKRLKRLELSVASRNRIGNSFWARTGFEEYLKRMYMKL